jgi:hypothetical protein
MLSPTKYVVFASSDIHFLNNGWYNLIENGITNKTKYLLLENHSVFMLDKEVIPIIGWFDENFGLGPHFDVDFMIRASEKGVMVTIYSAMGTYSHNSSEEETNVIHNDLDVTNRVANQIEDRLPMNDNYNEIIFKNKWQSDWAGWTPNSTPHPPTHISQVRRNTDEVDPHPLYTNKYR